MSILDNEGHDPLGFGNVGTTRSQGSLSSEPATTGGELAPAPMLWQPIETAPKDGTRVLIADSNVWMAVATFWPCNMYWTDDTISGLKLNSPTHWMPLPEPPK
jgi:hypothetical protein